MGLLGVAISLAMRTSEGFDAPIFHQINGSVSGIGIAADCKSVASAFLVQVQGDPPPEQMWIVLCAVG